MLSGELLHPELFDSLPIGAHLTKSFMEKRIAETLDYEQTRDPNVSIVIRALNEAARLEDLFKDIHKQIFSGEVEIIVVDNESTDNTQQVAARNNAKVVTLPKESFTYPRSMNVGVEAASHEIVFLTVGHALLSSAYNLHAGARHFDDPKVAGVFGTWFPNDNASFIERTDSSIGVYLWLPQQAHKIKKAGRGSLAATNTMISKSAWEELGRFDERYETGGEDTELARQMLMSGYDLIKEPALTVHHSHGLGIVNYIKQRKAFNKTLQGPHFLDRDALLARRPDLRKNQISE